MKQEFLQLAQTYQPERHTVYSWYMSEKLDGIRAWWDGGISRGIPCSEVPYANTTKHGRFKVPPIATGLWTRYAQPIQAPDWWLDQLPKFSLDGEIVHADGFQDTMSVARTTVNVDRVDWSTSKYAIFHAPPLGQVLKDRTINNTNMKKTLRDCLEWAVKRSSGTTWLYDKCYYEVYHFLKDRCPIAEGRNHYCLPQLQLPSNKVDLQEVMESTLKTVLDSGGEGIMLRSPVSLWQPERSWNLLKNKPFSDMEGIVVGYTWGDVTDVERSVSGEATNRLVGLMGSVRLRLDDGTEFDLGSGFKMPHRRMTATNDSEDATLIGTENPGKQVDLWIENPLFPRGTKLTFKYREMTNDGRPKEARFWRIRDDG